jgi:hypothetical protein
MRFFSPMTAGRRKPGATEGMLDQVVLPAAGGQKRFNEKKSPSARERGRVKEDE